jgi:hypothetical protein
MSDGTAFFNIQACAFAYTNSMHFYQISTPLFSMPMRKSAILSGANATYIQLAAEKLSAKRKIRYAEGLYCKNCCTNL